MNIFLSSHLPISHSWAEAEKHVLLSRPTQWVRLKVHPKTRKLRQMDRQRELRTENILAAGGRAEASKAGMYVCRSSAVCFSMLLYVCVGRTCLITKHRPCSTTHPILCSLYTYHPYKHPSIILIKTSCFNLNQIYHPNTPTPYALTYTCIYIYTLCRTFC